MSQIFYLLAEESAKPTPITINPYIVGLAFASLGIGLLIYWRGRSAASSPVCWLLIGLFPVFLLYSAFPTGTLSGTIMGFSVTGAIGAFIFIWWYGNKKSIEAFKVDELRQENEDLSQENQTLRNQTIGTSVSKTPKPITINETFSYSLVKVPGKKLALTTGDVIQCQCADIWVSSENTNMQMARFFDQSVSAAIRYFGAKRRANGDVEEDTIALQLKKQVGDVSTVQPATVLVTGSGELEKSNKVKKIFHVAAVIGQARRGYRTMDGVEDCVTNALREAAKFPDYKTILFPLLGTGTAKDDIRTTADRLFRAAISFLEKNPASKIESIYFLNFTDDQLDVCRALLEENDGVTKPAIKS
jgi:Macro domain